MAFIDITFTSRKLCINIVLCLLFDFHPNIYICNNKSIITGYRHAMIMCCHDKNVMLSNMNMAILGNEHLLFRTKYDYTKSIIMTEKTTNEN